MFLLDTNTSIHFMKGRTEVLVHFAKHGPGTVFLSAISYHELLYGALHSAAVQRHLGVVADFVAPLTVLPFTSASADHFGKLDLIQPGRKHTAQGESGVERRGDGPQQVAAEWV